MRLSLARLFWNQILICVSLSRKLSASSQRLSQKMVQGLPYEIFL
jgi:hypothetical protein